MGHGILILDVAKQLLEGRAPTDVLRVYMQVGIASTREFLKSEMDPNSLLNQNLISQQAKNAYYGVGIEEAFKDIPWPEGSDTWSKSKLAEWIDKEGYWNKVLEERYGMSEKAVKWWRRYLRIGQCRK